MKTKYEIGMEAYEEYMETNCSSSEISKKYGKSRTWMDTFIARHALQRNTREREVAKVLLDTYNYWKENQDIGVNRAEACRKYNISESRFSHFMKRKGLN